MTNSHLSWDALNAYADGTRTEASRADITEAGRADIESHVRACRECGETVHRIRALRTAAHALAGHAPAAPEGAWTAIAARIETAKVVPLHVSRATARRHPGWLAAAAVVLVVLSSGVTAWLMRGAESRVTASAATHETTATAAAPDAPGAPLRPDAAVTSDDARVPASLVRVERDYLEAVDGLAAVLAAARTSLDPETVRAVERNLRIIDEAIAEARAALLRDPASEALVNRLSRNYQQKLDLLRRVSAHASAS